MTEQDVNTTPFKVFGQRVRGQTTRILVINPNSSQSMTDGLQPAIDALDLPSSTEIYTYTGPASSPPSINDQGDIDQSTEAVLSSLKDEESWSISFDAVLIACFSVHPLVSRIQKLANNAININLAVTGIFEASILTALSLVQNEGQQWGIVTTGKFWEDHLKHGAKAFLGAGNEDQNRKFAGVQSTGLNASDFHHGVDPAVVRQKLVEATQRLLASDNSVPRVYVVIMGCAGMAGLESIIREAAEAMYGHTHAYGQLHVVDGVRAGILQLDHTIKNMRLRPGRE
ncbi:Asp/Glu/hydantoin racemase [Xylariaceae sp. FL1019]|nr:Asp/Glu/hydantoin racemase [Xylariaceae sp. FL1019]